jgi:hypothetical protein
VARRANRNGGSRARHSAPARKAADEKSSGPSLLRRRGVQAATIFLLLLCAYLANRDILPGNDATGNVRLAGNLVTHHRLVFTPEAEPYLFEWVLKTPEGEQNARFRGWQSQLNGEPIRRAFERGNLTHPAPPYFLMETRRRGVYANLYGVGAALVAVPFVAAAYAFAPDLYDRPSAGLLWQAAKVAAACAVAGSAVCLFLAALAFVRPGTAAWLAFAYGLGTCAWSTSSQALWQHGPMELFLALGTLFLLREDRRRAAYGVGLCYAMAFACRPTAAVAIVAAGGYYLLRDRRAFVRWAVGGLPVALALSAYNLHYFGKLVVLGQLGDAYQAASAFLAFAVPAAMAAPVALASSSSRGVFGTSLLVGCSGILLSPSRGLLVFSPVLVFTFWGLVRVWRDPRFSALRPVTLAAMGMCLLVARWHGWWGGWCYGYRLLTDAVTLMAFLAIPVAEAIRRRRVLAALLCLGLAWSVGVQVVGAFAYDVTGWNNRELVAVKVPGEEKPRLYRDAREAGREARSRGGSVEEIRADVNRSQGNFRLWSIRDSQILYYLEHFFAARQLKRAAMEAFLRERG